MGGHSLTRARSLRGRGESYELNAHSRQRRICLNLLCHHCVILSCFAQPFAHYIWQLLATPFSLSTSLQVFSLDFLVMKCRRIMT